MHIVASDPRSFASRANSCQSDARWSTIHSIAVFSASTAIGEKQNQQKAILDPSRTCQREHGTTNRKRQGHMAKRGFLPQPPNATKRVSCGREKMRDARDPLRFWARCVGCICQNFQLSAAYGVCLTGLDQFYLSRRLLCRQGQMKTDD